jgi:hypothetical protein
MKTPAAALLLLTLALSACAPKAPKGVDQTALDEAVSRAIGDPSTCVLISEAGKTKPVYRYNERLICDRAWPSCDKDKTSLRTINDLLTTTAADGQVRMQSCFTNQDGSRAVGWAAGPIPGTPHIYAAVMEGDRALPGRVMAARLALAFQKVGLQPVPQPNE